MRRLAESTKLLNWFCYLFQVELVGRYCARDGLTRQQWYDQLRTARKRQRYREDEDYRQKKLSLSRKAKARRRLLAAHDPEVRRKLQAERWRQEVRRRAKSVAHVETVDRYRVYDNHGGVCYLCGKYCDVDDFHVDHVRPLADGGPHTYENCRPTHPSCNMRKSDKPPLLALADVGSR